MRGGRAGTREPAGSNKMDPAASKEMEPAVGEDKEDDEDSSSCQGFQLDEEEAFADHMYGLTDDEDDEEVLEDHESQDAELSISAALAEKNYCNAGSPMEESEDTVKVEDYLEYINGAAESALAFVDAELNLPYETAPFQRIVINCIAMNKSVVLVKECGSGKMDCALKGALVKRITEEEPKGLAVVVQPLTSLMMEKMTENKIGQVAVLSMGQALTVLGEKEDGQTGSLSCEEEELYTGRYSTLIGHPESFGTPLGQQILSELQKRGLLLMIVLDEFHQYDDWDSFRPEMLKTSCNLRVFARKGAPVIAMTGTATHREIKRVTDMLGLSHAPPVLIHSCPIQKYHKFSVIRRPSNCYGLMGTTSEKGEFKQGLWQLLKRLYLDQFLKDLREGRKSKRCIIFFKSNRLLGAVYSLLQRLTGQFNPNTADFVMCHSSLLPPSDKMLQLRMEEITLYHASNRMLLGTNVPNLGLAIFCQPFDTAAALVQGAGRLSRRTLLGYRTAGQVYMLFNGQVLKLNRLQIASVGTIGWV